MNPIKRLISLSIFASLLLTSGHASTETSPQEQLEATVTGVIDILHTSQGQEIADTRKQVLEKLESSFSFDIIIRRTLGRNWNRLNAAQQDRITELITDLLIRAYTSELAGGDKPEIQFLKTDELGKNKIEIPTTVSYRNSYVNVSYRLANIKDRGWQVYDVLIEGTSIVSNYRGQFDEHFQTKSAEELLELIASKIDEYDA